MKARNLLLVGFLLWPAIAQAQLFSVGDYDFGLTESLYLDWHANESFETSQFDPMTGLTQKKEHSYDYYDLKSRLNLTVRSRWLQVGMRLDIASFQSDAAGEEADHFDDKYGQGHLFEGANTDFRVEKIYARMRFGAAGIEVGDVYGCLGKGIALCVKKVDELSTDTTLRGLKAYYNGRVVGGTVLAGLGNTVNVGDTIEEFLPDPNDLVSGAEIRYTPAWWMRITGHGSLLVDRQEVADTLGVEKLDVPAFISGQDPDELDLARRELLATVGPTLTFPDLWGHGSFFVEYDALVQTWTDGDETEHPDPLAGQVVYANATGHWDIFHLTAEVKWYESYLDEHKSISNLMGTSVEGPSGRDEFIYYGVLPPVDDESLLIRNDRPYDVVGGRIRADVEVQPVSGIAFVSFTDFEDTHLGPERTDEYNLRHVRAGWEQRLDDLAIVANLAGGYRMEDFEYTEENMWHVEGDVHFPLYGPHAMEVAGRHEAYTRPDNDQQYSISQAAATYSFAPFLALSTTYEHSEQPSSGGAARGHFFSVEAIYRFLPGSYVKLFCGSARGGLKCAGGMCRTFPPFEGIKGEVTLRF